MRRYNRAFFQPGSCFQERAMPAKKPASKAGKAHKGPAAKPAARKTTTVRKQVSKTLNTPSSKSKSAKVKPRLLPLRQAPVQRPVRPSPHAAANPRRAPHAPKSRSAKSPRPPRRRPRHVPAPRPLPRRARPPTRMKRAKAASRAACLQARATYSPTSPSVASNTWARRRRSTSVRSCRAGSRTSWSRWIAPSRT